MRNAVLHTRPLPDYLLVLLAQKVPAYGLPVIARLVRAYDFGFRFAPSRRSKLGDFTRAAGGQVTITVNGDLSPELFLITFLHEVAHLEATLARRRREAPHGRRWQRCYGALLQELCRLAEGLMPLNLRQALLAHSLAPTATLHADVTLAGLLLPAGRPEAILADGCDPVDSLASGTPFAYQGRSFLLSGKLIRRHYATELKSGRLFSFSSHCRVRILGQDHALPTQRLLLANQLVPGQEFIHRSRRLKLERRLRTRMECTDLKTGRRVELHGLMHVAV